jgi:hypothetical protein
VSEPAFDAENVKREILPRDEVLRRPKVLAGTKTGEPIPDFLSTPNGWGELLSALAARAAELIREMDETFDFRWQADMRAIKRWQAAYPGNDLVWPDHADLLVWLMEQIEPASAEIDARLDGTLRSAPLSALVISLLRRRVQP